MIGEREYRLRLKGWAWTEIAALVSCRPNTCLQRARNYAEKNGLPLERKEFPVWKKKVQAKPDGARWHKMHCGKGLTSERIAQKEGIPVEIVRSTLREYRERLWP